LHHWGLGFRQSSFRLIARALPGRIVSVFRYPLLFRQALVPSSFRLQVNRMAQRSSSEPLLTASRIQHRVPRRTVSKHPALQGLATSASSVTTGLVRFVAFTAAPFPVGPNFIEHKAVIRPEPRQSPGPLRHVRGFPALRLLWGLRRCVWTLVDSTPSHSMHSLPRSQ
jgi:hypothetical protein